MRIKPLNFSKIIVDCYSTYLNDMLNIQIIVTNDFLNEIMIALEFNG